jgi:hypothetical protein
MVTIESKLNQAIMISLNDTQVIEELRRCDKTLGSGVGDVRLADGVVVNRRDIGKSGLDSP